MGEPTDLRAGGFACLLAAIAKALGIGRASIYRALDA
jgi:DNA-binding phage protein